MYDERQSGTPISRRRVLAAIGTTSLASLAGCQTLFGEEDQEETGPDSLNDVKLAKLPSSYSAGADFIAVPSTDLVSTFHLRHKQQLHLARAGEAESGDFLSALYTIRTDADFADSKEKTIWLSPSGLNRINATPGWLVSVRPTAPHPQLETREEAKRNSQYVEQSIEAEGNTLLACAPNGGDIEVNTDKQALRVASELEESAWASAGYNEGGGADDRWYVDPSLTHPISYPELGSLISYDDTEREYADHDYDETYDHAVVFSGADADGILIGGLAQDEMKFKVRDALRERLQGAGADVTVRVDRGSGYAATDPMHLANRLTDDGHHGLQVAQSEFVRKHYWLEVADAIIAVFAEEP